MSSLFDAPDPPSGPGEPSPEGPGNLPELSVSELSGAVKRVVEGEFGRVRVRGEVGRVSRPRSGHMYLDLKDDRAVLASVIWKGQVSRLAVQPTEGDEVVATGRLTTFPGQSRYQLVIEEMSLAGMGALLAKLERLKAELAAEGLFAAERKKPLPYLPEVIGVITSPSGAVIRDILHRLADRFPRKVLIWPVAVQGQTSAGEVAHAIRGFNALTPGGRVPRPDVLIVARGGGSVEDLWGFNEEIVVRAAAASEIPLISAVGHETDTTLIDFAADRRAPTPTAAAELAVPVRAELLASLAGLEERRVRAAARGLADRRERLRALARVLPRPEALLAERAQRLDLAAERLPRALVASVQARRAGLATGSGGRFSPALLRTLVARKTDRLAGLRLRPAPLRAEIERRRERLAALSGRLDRSARSAVDRERERHGRAGRLLETLSYKQTLARGYAVVRLDGAPAGRSSALPEGARVEIELADGRRAAALDPDGAAGGGDAGRPEAPSPDPGAAPPRKSAPKTPTQKTPGKTPPGQGDLFG
ncbi:exodeoxyribonuclease VII large subunit [uncultured Albimonas sp.]|uniref:exodeoxyribonuclease VII large subunit n=1 Tax=uncultured Albimonas sp. TaxID=1331701 RepID=UPI0030EB5DB8